MTSVSNGDLEDIAKAIHARKLTSCAILLLEAHKPISVIIDTAMVLVSPIIRAIAGPKHQQTLTVIFNSRENMEALISRLELLRETRVTGR